MICKLCGHSHTDGMKPTEDGRCVKLLFDGGGVRYCNCPGESEVEVGTANGS